MPSNRPVRKAVAAAKPIDFKFQFDTGSNDGEGEQDSDSGSEAGSGIGDEKEYEHPGDADDDDEEEGDFKPEVTPPPKNNKRKSAVPNTPPSTPPQKRAKKEPTSPKPPRGAPRGDKFVATPAIRTAMINEMLKQVSAVKMDWKSVVQEAGEGTEKQVSKYYGQTFRKHLVASVASSSFGAK